MARWVALLRGMNIGGNRLPVAAMRAAAVGLGWRDVRTHLASGNLVFDAEGAAPGLAGALRAALAAQGLDVPILVLPGATLRAMLAACPFAPAEGRHVHAFFLWSEPTLDRARLDALRAPSEEMELRPGVAWLHAPGGIGRSALALKLDKAVTGTKMTARNLNTVQALARMVDEGAPP